ncbi:hypothetical protein PsYK624_125360 [Phanerochaete sordida]|uniref:Uncharacterized protein n=1 Tax=Phanerochaete sordida TaxID=48140 RepID=A0A9P3LJL5_9APHY|nr:hypothetical protein PsYK624_125360 [Phanerochaete sordida]
MAARWQRSAKATPSFCDGSHCKGCKQLSRNNGTISLRGHVLMRQRDRSLIALRKTSQCYLCMQALC